MEALLHINGIASSYFRCYTLFAACELGLFDHLNMEPMSAEGLASRLQIHADGCRRLLICLVTCGLVEREGSLYRNSPMGKCLTSSSPIPYHELGLADLGAGRKALGFPHSRAAEPQIVKLFQGHDTGFTGQIRWREARE